jgi:hypothetical protein
LYQRDADACTAAVLPHPAHADCHAWRDSDTDDHDAAVGHSDHHAQLHADTYTDVFHHTDRHSDADTHRDRHRNPHTDRVSYA